ncbi:MAG TPA: aquaporin [Thermoplasmata archaeon]|nr:aquaporin [Thermoplasmata archaeon]HEV2428918.1 aquaporin [Thermoplasmata archaeon]
MTPTASQRYLAEFLGTFALLLVGGGAAVFTLSALNPLSAEPFARVVAVSAAFGFVVAGLAYAFGAVSGGHFNPAVTLSMACSRRLPIRDVVPYLLAQILGGIVGISVVARIAAGSSGAYALAQSAALGSQCYAGSGAPAGCGFSLESVFLLEFALTFVFVLVIQLTTRPESGTANLAPLAIGLTLLVTNLIGIPVDGASLNPVRSFSPALLSSAWPGDDWALQESWLFWAAPILGGVLASIVQRAFRTTPTPASP